MVTAALVMVVLCFVVAPSAGNVYFGDDFSLFRKAALRLVHGNTEIYNVDFHPSYYVPIYYVNSPWLAVFMIPFALIPERLGWAILSTLTLIITMALMWRWLKRPPGILILVLALLSPTTVQAIIHGQVDPFIVATVFLPYTLWPLTVAMKPQAGLGLLFEIPRDKWVTAALPVIVITGISFLIFGFWPSDILAANIPQVSNNVWREVWPFSALVGMAALIAGIRTSDERFFVIASPFLFPYASLHSLYGIWVALTTMLRKWQTLLLWCIWWALIIRPIL